MASGPLPPQAAKPDRVRRPGPGSLLTLPRPSRGPGSSERSLSWRKRPSPPVLEPCVSWGSPVTGSACQISARSLAKRAGECRLAADISRKAPGRSPASRARRPRKREVRKSSPRCPNTSRNCRSAESLRPHSRKILPSQKWKRARMVLSAVLRSLRSCTICVGDGPDGKSGGVVLAPESGPHKGDTTQAGGNSGLQPRDAGHPGRDGVGLWAFLPWACTESPQPEAPDPNHS